MGEYPYFPINGPEHVFYELYPNKLVKIDYNKTDKERRKFIPLTQEEFQAIKEIGISQANTKLIKKLEEMFVSHEKLLESKVN
jgi:hypothetical protein